MSKPPSMPWWWGGMLGGGVLCHDGAGVVTVLITQD